MNELSLKTVPPSVPYPARVFPERVLTKTAFKGAIKPARWNRKLTFAPNLLVKADPALENLIKSVRHSSYSETLENKQVVRAE